MLGRAGQYVESIAFVLKTPRRARGSPERIVAENLQETRRRYERETYRPRRPSLVRGSD